MSGRPAVTRSTHILPFERLSPLDFERLCLWLVRREGYERAEHVGVAGGDQGRDVVAWRAGRRVVFQCKRVGRLDPSCVQQEIKKLRSLPAEDQPEDVIFVVSTAVPVTTRDLARASWGDQGSCEFWAVSELDERVKCHPAILREFFDLSTEGIRTIQPTATVGTFWTDSDTLEAPESRHIEFARSKEFSGSFGSGTRIVTGGLRLLVRHAYLHSLLEDTNTLLGDRDLRLIHSDDSFTLFYPRRPNPWLGDIAQVEWLLENGRQVHYHGSRFLERIFEFPLSLAYRLPVRERQLFRATVKAVLHLSMYEGLLIGLWPISGRHKRDRRLSFSYAQSRAGALVWPAWEYYEGFDRREAVRGVASDLFEVEKRLREVLPQVCWLTQYGKEHFSNGEQIALPRSWRKFIFLLHAGRCDSCEEEVKDFGELSYGGPTTPEESPYHRFVAGNSVLFNLTLLCRSCNRRKAERMFVSSEEDIGRIIPDPRLAYYFRRSLAKEPSTIEHRLPEIAPTIGDELAVG